MAARCENCDRELSDQPNVYPDVVYVHHGKITCEDCLTGMGVLPLTESNECGICGAVGPDITRVVKRLQTGQELVSCDDFVACVMRAEARQLIAEYNSSES